MRNLSKAAIGLSVAFAMSFAAAHMATAADYFAHRHGQSHGDLVSARRRDDQGYQRQSGWR